MIKRNIFLVFNIFNSWEKILQEKNISQAGLGGLVNGISTFFRLFNAKAIPLEEQ